MGRSGRPARRAPRIQITERDRALLAFLSEHRVIETDHVRALLGISAAAADTRLRALAAAKLLVREAPFRHRPPSHRITRRGLAAIASALPVPHENLSTYAHDVGLAWLWLAAQQGRFGPLAEVISERQMRSHDGKLLRAGGVERVERVERAGGVERVEGVDRAGGPDSPPEATGGHRPLPGLDEGALRPEPLAVRLGGYGRGGAPRLHYPDLLLVTPDGHRIAVELELSGKGRLRRERILAAYGADARIDAVLYLVTDRAVGEQVRSSARRLGIGSMVHVQSTRPAGRSSVGAEARARSLRPVVSSVAER
jgi:hypothetical protein